MINALKSIPTKLSGKVVERRIAVRNRQSLQTPSRVGRAARKTGTTNK
jgi:hypothetical protein